MTIKGGDDLTELPQTITPKPERDKLQGGTEEVERQVTLLAIRKHISLSAELKRDA